MDNLDPNAHRKALKYSRLARAFAGVALVFILTAAGARILSSVLPTQAGRDRGVIALAAIGVILMLCQLLAYTRKATPEGVLSFYRDPHYWGIVLLCTAVAIYLVLPMMYPVREKVVAEKSEPKVAKTNEVPEIQEVKAKPEPKPEFPLLKVSGVLVNGNRSSAVINSCTVMLGESIAGVELVEVLDEGIFVQMGNVKRPYWLSQPKTAAR